MLDIMNRYTQGYIVLPVVVACCEKKLFLKLKTQGPLSEIKITRLLNANQGHLHVALRLFESLAWIRLNSMGAYELTMDEVSYKIIHNIPKKIRSLYSIPIKTLLKKNASIKVLKNCLQYVIDIEEQEQCSHLMIDLIQGAIIVPLLIALYREEKTDLLFNLPRKLDNLVSLFFLNKQWAEEHNGQVTVTPLGHEMIDQALNMAAAASYAPMLARIKELIFGSCNLVIKKSVFGRERHIDRELNAVAFGFQQERFFKEIEETLLTVFNREPYEEQPKYIVVVGCCEGTFLKRIYEEILQVSSRGKVLEQYPLIMVAVDSNQNFLDAAKTHLHDIPHYTLLGDGTNPKQLTVALNSLGITDLEHALFIRLFLNTGRCFIHSQDESKIADRYYIPYAGAYVDKKGKSLSASHVVQSYVEHFEFWSKLIDKHGLIILEAHSLLPESIESGEAFYFDACSAFARHYLIEAEVFLFSAAEAGLFPKTAFSKPYSKSLSHVQSTLNYFEKRPYIINYAQYSDLRRLLELEMQCWPEGLSASKDEIHQRIKNFPEGQMVVRLTGLIVAVIYSQRIEKQDSIIFAPQGSIIQIMGISVVPQMQNQGIEKMLLEFITLWASMKNGITKIVNGSHPTYQPENKVIVQQTPLIEHVNSQVEETDAVAIIGMAAVMPGAKNVTVLWDNLKAGRSAIDKKEINNNQYKWGGFIKDVDCFDPIFFNITPAQAQWMDPQQRLLLETSWHALEDAGYTTNSNSRCGVYVGVMNNEYQELIQQQAHTISNGYDLLGNTNSLLSARIANFLNLKGPTISLDTACSSSLVATHMACQVLNDNEADLMLVGGVTLNVTDTTYRAMLQLDMLSTEGTCKAFDNDGDGFVPGDGCAVLVLKRLKDARNDGDKIHGIIRGSGINQDGKKDNIIASSIKAQHDLELSVYNNYQINPEQITYVEAHGIGAKLGDAIEVEALTQAFRAKTSKKQFCALGSIKSNIGHTSAAAGLAGIIKILLCLKHHQLVPTINVTKHNESIDFASSPFYLNTDLKSWPSRGNKPRMAAVSSFGFSGTNAHMVIEEGPEYEVSDLQTKPQYLVTLSANHPDSLRQRIEDLYQYLNIHTELPLEAIAYTLNVRRSHFSHRCALVVASKEELQKKLHLLQKAESKIPTDCFQGNGIHEVDDVGMYGQVLIGSLDQLRVHGAAHSDKYKELLGCLAILYTKGYEIDWELVHQDEAKQKIDLPFYPFLKQRYWVSISQGAPTFEMVRSHGLSVVEQSVPPVVSEQQTKPYYLVTVSAKHPESLRQRVEDLYHYLEKRTELPLEAVAYTLNTRRSHFNYRCALVVASKEELRAKLNILQTDLVTTPINCFQGNNHQIDEQVTIFKQILINSIEKLRGGVVEPDKYKELLEIFASLYSKGYELDWQLLHYGEAKETINLPTYPFLKERYWVFPPENLNNTYSEVQNL